MTSDGSSVEALALAVPLTLYNLGAPGYGDFVIDISAELTYGKCQVTYHPLNNVKLGRGEGPRETPTYLDDWGGFAIGHGKAVTSSVEFSGLARRSNKDLACVLAERFMEEAMTRRQSDWLILLCGRESRLHGEGASDE